MSAALLRVVIVLVIIAMAVPRLDGVERSMSGFGMTVVLLVAAVMVMFLSAKSGASKLICSNTRSMMVYSRRAPMFCVRRFTSNAIWAIASIASSSNRTVIPSVLSSSIC